MTRSDTSHPTLPATVKDGILDFPEDSSVPVHVVGFQAGGKQRFRARLKRELASPSFQYRQYDSTH